MQSDFGPVIPLLIAGVTLTGLNLVTCVGAALHFGRKWGNLEQEVKAIDTKGCAWVHAGSMLAQQGHGGGPSKSNGRV